MPRYLQATTFDFVRSVKNTQGDVRQLQIQLPAQVKKTVNQIAASLNTNPYFWGGDSSGWVANNGTLVIASDPPTGAPNPYAGLFTIVNAGVGAALEESGQPFPVVPTQQYVLTAWVYTPTTSCTLGIAWQDPTHALLSTSSQSVTVTANTWTLVSMAAFAPTTAAFAYPRVAPTDGVGNTIYAEAVIVQLSTAAYQPGSSPLTVESWHAVSLPSSGGFSGTARVKLLPTPNLAVLDVAVRWTNTAGSTFSFGSLPSAAYYPLTPRHVAVGVGGTPTSMIPSAITIPTSGAVQIYCAASSGGSGSVDWYGGTYVYPLD
jgi:hypothetical protein